jgi:isopentenyl diphosphate isomerase/L-lactate dehydrogenase-like FMN-dependent dehydrogenase
MAALDNCYNVFDLRDAAKKRLPRGVFEFVDRSTEDELALRNNRAAFEKIKLKHRALVDVSGRSTKTTLFGKEISLPMAIAPTGAAGLCWHEGELELAKAAARAKIPFTLATGAMTSMEKIAKEANFRLWFQLYVWKQRELSYQLIERAKNNGFEALIVTTDTIVPPNREYNAKNGFLLPFHPTMRFNRVDDALKAISYGVDGLIVSNHGGRNMDSAAATIDMLPEIAEAVGDKATVILDSGVRRGSDIVKAVALGAKCVLTGRATLYGTAVGGEAGASKAVGIIQTEMDKTMAYTGCNRVDEISTDIFFGDRGSNRLMAG